MSELERKLSNAETVRDRRDMRAVQYDRSLRLRFVEGLDGGRRGRTLSAAGFVCVGVVLGAVVAIVGLRLGGVL